MDPVEPCLAVVIPCFNEHATMLELLDRVLGSPLVAEVIAVDDGSTDGTAELLDSVRDPRVRVLRQPMNFGKGAALRRAFREVTSPYVLVQDADLEYDPDQYPRMLEPLLSGHADVVYGSRFTSGQARRVLYLWHAVGNKVITTASNMVTNLNLTDIETGYKAFRREVVETLDLREDRFGVEAEITAKVAKGGWRVFEVGISYDGRTYDEGKKTGWRDGARALYAIARYSKIADRLDQRVVDRDAPLAHFDDADSELAETLDSLGGAPNYADWIVSMCDPYLGTEVLEVGGGHGDFTERLCEGRSVTVTEISKRCIELLHTRFDGNDNVTVRDTDLSAMEDRDRFDCAVFVNVLEHIEDDEDALRNCLRLLRPGGRLILYVPAFDGLYSEFDRRIGHHRRYRLSQVAELADRAGFDIVDAHYVGSVGAVLWWGYARQLRREPTKPGTVGLYDRLIVPALRRAERRRRPPFGQSVFLVAQRPDAGAATGGA